MNGCPLCGLGAVSPRAALERGREDILRELGRLPTLEDLWSSARGQVHVFRRAGERLEARRADLVAQYHAFDDALRRLAHHGHDDDDARPRRD